MADPAKAPTLSPANDDRRRAIQKAVDEVGRDGSIPLEQIEAWVDSWGRADEFPMPLPRK